jgi:hypothetical protein
MQKELSPDPIGGQFGTEAIDTAEERAAQYCAHEQERIALANEPKLLAVRAESQLLLTKQDKLAERIRNAPPPGDARIRRRKAIFYACVAAAMMLSGFYFTRLTFDPFRMGFGAWVIAGGAALIVPLLLHWLLKLYGEALIRILVTGACIAALASLSLLASIRCGLLKQQMQTQKASSVINTDNALVAEKQNTFYEENSGRLQVALALLALATEIAAGLAVYESRRYARDSGDDPEALEREMAEVQEQLVAHVHEARRLENEPREWASTFWRDYRRSTLNAINRINSNGVRRLSFVLLCVVLLGSVHASAAEPLNLVIAVDLSASVTGAKGLDARTEFDRNLSSVGRLLAATPAGSKITVVGITDHSFSAPYVLLSAQLDTDEGYFHERIQGAHQELVRAWQKRCANLASRFQRTDLLGSLLVTAQLLPSGQSRTALVIFSDMRQDTLELNLDRRNALDVAAAMGVVERGGLVPDLKGVEVYALGVDAAGKSPGYWQSLRAFWAKYFAKAGATLRCYSMFRELPDFAH